MQLLLFLKKFKYYISLFFILAIGLLAFWWYLFGSPSSTKTTLAPPPPKIDFEVLYTNEGYNPNILEVPLGSFIAFKNTSEFPMWTASDPHPVHSDFSPFDSQKDYFTGETYIFEFTSAGTFAFHNHEKSNHRGIIRVVDPNNPLSTIDKTKEGQRATRDKLISSLDQKDPNSIFTVIDAIEADNNLSRDCHDMAHDIGHEAYELFGFSGAMTFSNKTRLGHTSVDDICAGGYMHGILEELFLHQPNLKNNPSKICVGVPAINRDSCFHGVGHGLMFVNKRDVPVSLKDCRGLKEPIDTRRCFEGVWMEMFWGATEHAGAGSLGWTLEEPLAACVSAQEDEKPTCFLYAHLGFLRTHSRDFTGAINLCTKSGLGIWDARYCLRGVGITMMKHFTSQHLERSEKLVEALTAGDKYAYYEGVVGYALISNVSKQDVEKFCGLLQNDKEICLKVLEAAT